MIPGRLPPAKESSTSPAELGQLARGGALNLIGAGVSSAMNILLVVVIARSVTQSQAGRFFAATSVFLLVAMVAKLGANTGLVYFIARLRALGRPDLVSARLRTALTPVLGAAALLGAALFIFATPLADLTVRGDTTQTATYIRILAAFVPVAALSDVALAATRGYRKMRPTVMLDLVSRPVLQLGLTIVVVALDAPLGWLALAWAAPYLPEMIAALLWLRSVRRRDTRVATPTSSAGFGPGDFWKFTGPRAVTSVVHLALQRLDIILVAALLGPAQAAIYTVATRFLVAGQLANQAISTVAQPRLSELLALGDRASAGSVYQVASGWVVLLAWPVYLLAIVFSTQFLAIFGKGYTGATSVIIILAGAMLLKTICGMVDVVLNMAGRTVLTLINSIIALTVMVGVDLVLIPRWGIVGAATGWAAAILVNNLLPLSQTILSLRMHPFGAGTWRAALLAGVFFGALPLAAHMVAARWTDGTDVAWLVVAAGAGSLGYVLACSRLRRALSLDVLRDLAKRRNDGPTTPATAGGTP